MKTLALIICFLPVFVQAQYDPVTEVRNAAIGGITSVVPPRSTAIGNPALLPAMESRFIALAAQNRFGMKEFNAFALSGGLKRRTSGMALSVAGTGFELYRKQQYLAAAGLRMNSFLSAGISIGHNSIRIPESTVGSSTTSASIGLSGTIGEQATVGIELMRIQPANGTGHKQTLRFGSAYRISSSVHVLSEWQTASNLRSCLRFAVQYLPVKSIVFGYSISSFPFTNTVAFGYAGEKFRFDTAVQHQSLVGYSPALSFTRFF
ncbi:MAG: hypothetical protein V4616_07960 [Bacteroidota bacterium]